MKKTITAFSLAVLVSIVCVIAGCSELPSGDSIEAPSGGGNPHEQETPAENQPEEPVEYEPSDIAPPAASNINCDIVGCIC